MTLDTLTNRYRDAVLMPAGIALLALSFLFGWVIYWLLDSEVRAKSPAAEVTYTLSAALMVVGLWIIIAKHLSEENEKSIRLMNAMVISTRIEPTFITELRNDDIATLMQRDKAQLDLIAQAQSVAQAPGQNRAAPDVDAAALGNKAVSVVLGGLYTAAEKLPSGRFIIVTAIMVLILGLAIDPNVQLPDVSIDIGVVDPLDATPVPTEDPG